MIRTINVNNCNQCPFSTYDGWNEILWCIKLNKAVEDIDFTKDCPLKKK